MDRDPPRLKEDTSPDYALRSAVLSHGDDFGPSEGELTSLTERLAPFLGPPEAGGGATGGTGSISSAAQGVGSSIVPKIVIGSLAILTVGAAFLFFWPRSEGVPVDERPPSLSSVPRESSPSRVSEPPRELSTTLPLLVEVEPSAETERPEPRPPRMQPRPLRQRSKVTVQIQRDDPATTTTAPQVEEDEAVEELDEIGLLQRAYRALRSGRPARALEITDEHRRMELTRLDQERERIAIESLLSLGRVDEARARAAHFTRRFPGSGYGPQIRSLLEGNP